MGMKTTPLFSMEFNIQTRSKKRRTRQQVAAEKIAETKAKSFQQLSGCFGRLIPEKFLRQNEKKKNSRTRIFSKKTTFWAFFSQMICADGGCAEVLTKLRACAATKGLCSIPISTGSYSRARMRLTEQEMFDIFEHASKVLQEKEKMATPQGRRVIVVDGTGLKAADTAANQNVWPQQKQQKPGCGFPSLRVCACFSLETGGILSYEIGNKKSNELRLFRKQLNVFEPGDILLGDKMFCSYYDLWNLQQIGVESVATLPAKNRKPIEEATATKKIGKNDVLIKWKKPAWNKKSAYAREEWELLPAELVLRQIKVEVKEKGFRVKSFYIITPLLEPIEYPVEELAELYFRRWEVELNFDDLKTTMGMDELRCKSPAMVRKELMMYFIAYNAIRWLIHEAAEKENVEHLQVSFKGAMQSLRQWEPHLGQPGNTPAKNSQLIEELNRSISGNLVLCRPNRKEPRCVKRRPKPYQRLTKPRGEMKEIEHRSKYSAKAA
jgi:hypothetical protein